MLTASAHAIFIAMPNTESITTPLRTWTIEGETPITVSVYRPAVTINPDQVEQLSSISMTWTTISTMGTRTFCVSERPEG